MTINEFSKELLSISEQYIKIEANYAKSKHTLSHCSHCDLLHIQLVNAWSELGCESKDTLVNYYWKDLSDANKAKYEAITKCLRNIERSLLSFYCTKDYRENAYSITSEMSKIFEAKSTDPLAK